MSVVPPLALDVLPPGLESALLDSWAFFLHLAVVLVPLFVGGSFLVGLAGEYLPPEAVERRLRGHDEGVGNVAAAAFGAVTPFCSCSTVPALAGLLQAGAPLGLAFSFLLASPLVNEIAVVLLLGLFGVEVTVLYVLATFVAAVVGGIVVGRLGLDGDVKDLGAVLGAGATVEADGGDSDCRTGGSAAACRTDGGATACRTDADGGTADPHSNCASGVGRTHRERVGTAARGAWSFLVDTFPYLLLGMTAGALIHGVVPVEVVRGVLGPENPVAVPLAALAGAPIYVSMSGMLPIAASLSDQGIAIGTVLAFVVGGAGVSVPNLVLLNRLFERRLLVVYAGTVVAIGTTVGVLFNAVLVP
ncbi:MAG: permease [Haloarculaceae archaeon]